ncbi:MAG: apolipoprotein N-acyltransferase [Candidatus Deianiraeaceae bacterium]|jgi:apolipoprotein N-acyltransferase
MLDKSDVLHQFRKFIFLRTIFWDVFYTSKKFTRSALRVYYLLHNSTADNILQQIYNYRNSWMLCFFTGVLAGFSQPPISAFWVLPLAFILCIRMIDFAQSRQALTKCAILFNIGYGVTVFYWPAYGVYIFGFPAFAVPIASVGIIFLSGIIPSIMLMIFGIISTNTPPFRRIFLFASMWVISEYLRGFVVFKFPFGLIGYSVEKFPSLYQVASVFGVFGLSFIIVLWGCSFYIVLFTDNKLRFISYFRTFIIINISLFFIAILGKVRLYTPHLPHLPHKVAIIQGNSSVGMSKIEQFKIYSLMTAKLQNNINVAIDVIIWPESAGFPFDVERDVKSFQYVNRFIAPNQTFIFSGVRRHDNGDIFNAMYIYDNKKLRFHNKHHLVPYGEYLPIIQRYKIGKVLARGAGIGFTSGKGIAIMPTIHGNVLPLICYEVAYSGKILHGLFNTILHHQSADYAINTTNDEWFGLSSGPYQHFAMVKYRAVEEGISFVRASNNGFSAIVDPYGRVSSKQTNLFEKDIVVSTIPKKLPKGTLFALWGNIPILLLTSFVTMYYILTYLYSIHTQKIHCMVTDFLERRAKRKEDPSYKRRY